MSRIIAIGVILCCWVISNGQTDAQKSLRTDEIRLALERLRQSGELSIDGVLYDMRTFDGKLIYVEHDSFTIDSKRKSLPRSIMTINFKQVVELNGKGVSISYFPDPDISPFADWDAVKKLTYGDTVEIDRVSGGDIVGVLFRVSEAAVTLMDGNRTKEIGKDDVKRLFLARREPHSIGKALKGAGKGARSVGRGSGSSQIGAAAVEGAIRIGAATAGAVGAVARRSPNDRLLIYAR
jgi:hypothetical protein